MTGQVNFNGHYDAPVRLAAILVNTLISGEVGGKPHPAPYGHDQRAAVTDALRTVDPGRALVTSAQAERFAAHAHALRAVFTAVATGDVDAAARHLNNLIGQTGAQPHLTRHDGQPWHLHYHGTVADLADVWAGSCAAALAVVVGSDARHRLGLCTAASCDRVYVDTSHNGTRKFCSTTCQNRVKNAAYRARTRE